MKFKFSSKDLISFKEEMDWTWEELAKKFGVEQRVVYYWKTPNKKDNRAIPPYVVRLTQLYRLLKAKGLMKYVDKF